MLTLEKQVFQFIEERLALPDSIKLKTDKPFILTDAQKLEKEYLGEILLDLSKRYQELADEVEEDWEKYGSIQKIEEYQNTSRNIKLVVQDLERLLTFNKEIREKQNLGDKNIKKGLRKIKEALRRYDTVLNDTLEFLDIASQVQKIRTEGLDSKKIQEAKEILDLI